MRAGIFCYRAMRVEVTQRRPQCLTRSFEGLWRQRPEDKAVSSSTSGCSSRMEQVSGSGGSKMYASSHVH